MPEIDNDLFKVLVVALLAIGALLLLSLLAALSGVRKLLKDQVAQTRELRGDLASGAAVSSLAPSFEEERRDEPALDTPAEAAAPTPEPTPLLGGAAAAGAGSGQETPPVELHGLPSEEVGLTRGPTEPGPGDQGAATPVAQGADVTETSDDPFSQPPQPAEEDPFAASSTSDDPFGTSSSSAADPFAGTASSADEPFASGSSTDDPFAPGPTSDEPFASGATLDDSTAASTEDPFASRPTVDDSSAATADEPFAASTSDQDENPFVREADQPVSQSTPEEPDDQPFERNGRWFFRRDNELLVYEEGTGEWVPADPADLEPPAPAPAATPGFSSDTGGEPGGVGTDEPEDTARLDTVEDPRPTAGGGFWKCPSCGAVNGSSASTCRMCFSARP